MTHEPTDTQGRSNESDLCGTLLLGRYKVLERLGKGGMGVVYLGEHVTIGKKFAIKVLGSEFARRPDLVQRFLQEARAASMIAQQNVVEISDFGDTPDGSVFFVMEYLDGEDLGATLQRERRLAWDRVQHMMVQVCRALEAAHAEGIVHRDMKPDNCFRITRGKDPDFIKVLDFGIAKVQTGEGSGGKGLTQTGMVFGTPEYMAPEQAEGVAIDHRVDVYAVGVIMYELLCGRVPFSGTTFMGILTKHMFEVPEAPSAVNPEAEIPVEAEAIVLKAMQKDPKLRFANMAEMLAAIEAVGTGAAAVEVVAESIVRPAKGPTAFAKRGAGPSTATALQPGQQARAGSSLGLWLGAAGLLAAAVVTGVIVFGDKARDQQQATAPPPVAEPEPSTEVVAAPAPEPAPAPTPAPPSVVKLQFTTNVPVQIVDPRDQAIFGTSADVEGIEIEQSEQPLALLLRAEGYEPLPIEVVPNKDKRYEFALVKVEQRRPGDRPRPAASSETPAPEPTPTPEPERPHSVPDGDLKNPFGH